jgi:tetratricopeptide (TPR) repeat protein
LRELKALERQENLALALDSGNLVSTAKAAIVAGDRTAAQHFWQEALVRYPVFAKSSHDALDVLLGLQRFDEAESLMLEGRERFNDPFYAEGYALVAEHRGEISEAILRWNMVRKTWPGGWISYVHGINCLCRAGRLNAAEDLAQQAIKRFPDEIRTWLEWARTAEYGQDWAEAIRRWDTVCKKFQHVHGDLGVARGLEALGRTDDAERRLTEAQVRRPLVAEIALALARLASQRGDNEEAVLRWADARKRFPLLQFGYQGGFRELLKLGRYSEAETILLTAIDRFPAEAWPIAESASLAHLRLDWTSAAARWGTVRAGWPDRRDGYLRGIEALDALGRYEEAVQLRRDYDSRFGPLSGIRHDNQ